MGQPCTKTKVKRAQVIKNQQYIVDQNFPHCNNPYEENPLLVYKRSDILNSENLLLSTAMLKNTQNLLNTDLQMQLQGEKPSHPNQPSYQSVNQDHFLKNNSNCSYQDQLSSIKSYGKVQTGIEQAQRTKQ